MTTRGFTLIEILVVIAIIGILSAVVLASLGTARDKGTDAAIISNLSTLQTQAELFYSNGSTYGPGFVGTGNCLLGGIMFVTDAVLARAISATESINGAGNGMKCYISSGTYAVQSPLVADPSKYWCVDSAGNAKQVVNPIDDTSTTYVCPAN